MTEHWKVEYDKRQYALMADHLNRFDEGVIDLSTLIAGLDTLLECLEAADRTWKDEFRIQWGKLEEVYAVALERRESVLDYNSKKLVTNAIKDLRRLLADRTPAE